MQKQSSKTKYKIKSSCLYKIFQTKTSCPIPIPFSKGGAGGFSFKF